MRRPAVVLLLAYLAVMLGLTLGGLYQPHAPRNFVPFRSMGHDLRAGGRHLIVNFLGNLVAFLPMGALVPVVAPGRRPALRVAAASLGFSLVIEILQGVSGLRVADVDDLILNTIGGLMGYGLLLGWRGRRAQKA